MRALTAPFSRRRAAPLLVGFALLVGCATTEGPPTTFPPTTFGPDRPTSAAVDQTRALVAAALGTQRLAIRDVETPYRPAESPLLATAPRRVFQVTLQQEPDKGFIVIYEFPDPGSAASAAAEQQAYLVSGPGRIQAPQGTTHVIRVVGTTVTVYDWLPGAAVDSSAPGIQTALETVGTGYVVSN